MLCWQAVKRRRAAAAPLTFVLLFALSACGFQLRGQLPLASSDAESSTIATALNRVYLDDQVPARARPTLSTKLRRALRANGVDVLQQPADDAARLVLLDVSDERRILATGRAGAVRETLLSYRLRFSLLDAASRPLLGPEQISVSRDVLYDETDILGAVSGEQLSREQLIDDAVAALLRRLRAAAGSAASP